MGTNINHFRLHRFAAPIAAVIAACLVLCGRPIAAQDAAESIPLSRSGARVYEPGQRASSSAPVNLAPGPHLLIDESLIAASDNLERQVNTPQRDPAIPNPVITGKEDGCFQPYMSVLRTPDTGRFRIWFGHRVEDFNGGRSHIACMDSEDGIHWQRPARVLNDPAPIQFGVSVIDDGPGFPNAEQRYKYGWYMDGGLKIAASPDGLAWTPLTDGPVLRHNHDITGLFRDTIRKRYVATISVYRTGDAWSGQRRITMQSASNDLVTWQTPHYVVTPDSQDAGETQFYAMDGYLERGPLTIGLVKVLRDEVKVDNPPDPPDAYGMGYTALAWTHDGETWYRDRTHFFDPDPKKGAWDHAHAWIDEQVLVGDEVFLYYGGYARGHKVNRFEERQIGLLRIPRDRYVARVAGEKPGHLITPVLMLNAGRITLNADASQGSIVVEVLDEQRQPIPGFTAQDTTPLVANGLDLPKTWAKPLQALNGKPVCLRFTLRNARLYAFETTANH